jgi:arylsulfatase A-like enzyme
MKVGNGCPSGEWREQWIASVRREMREEYQPACMCERPNVIVFLTDQQRWDSTGHHGNPLELTPNLDRIARQGTHINTSITCQPVCGPARSSLQTGHHEPKRGVHKNDSMALGTHTPTLARHFTSDHGCHFKTRGNEREYKRSCQDASVRVPTTFTGPGFFGGGEVAELVSLIDLPPTLLDAAGLPVPDSMQGQSIMPLIRDGQRARREWRNEVSIQISESEIGRAIRTPRWKYSVTAIGLDGRSPPGADEYTETHLYDLEVDPYELNNLPGLESHRELSDHLKQRLICRMVEAGEPAPSAIHNAPTRMAPFARLLAEEITM